MLMRVQDFLLSSKLFKKLKITWFLSTIGMILFVTGMKVNIILFLLSFVFFGLAALCIYYIERKDKERLIKESKALQWRL